MTRVNVLDTTCRDGSHAVMHQHSLANTQAVVEAVDRAGVDLVEVAHGDGFAGSSLHFGVGREEDNEYIATAAAAAEHAKICALLVPGLGTVDELKAGSERGLQVVRVATHVTESDLARAHIEAARELGVSPIGFLMMTHMASPARIAESARMLADYGADVVYLADSAGHQLPADIARRVDAVLGAVGVPVGVHTHNNLGLAIGNAIAGVEAGATFVDGTLCGLGAGAGNAQIEVLAVVLDRAGYETGIDLPAILSAAEEVGRPLLHRPQIIDADGLMIGRSGLYSTFLLPARHAAEIYGVSALDILAELGNYQLVAGQEDMIIDIAYELAARRRSSNEEAPIVT